MNITGRGTQMAFDLPTLMETKEEKIRELKLRLRGKITLEEEMDLLMKLSKEMRDLFYIREKLFSDSCAQ